MKSRYKRKALYNDDGVWLLGYVDKRGFHPDKNLQCGFGLQILNNKEKKNIKYMK